MKTKAIIMALALSASTGLLTAHDSNQSPDAQRPPRREGSPGGPGGPGGQGGFHLLPPRAMEQLNLTDDQKKQLADLEADVKAKVEKILTAEQLQQLKQMRPMMRPGGPGGAGPDGGQGGPGGPPPGEGNGARPQRPQSE